MNNKKIAILKTIFDSTTQSKVCMLDASSFKQGKKIYRRIKELEKDELIFVFRSKGEPNLYRMSDKGVKYLIESTNTYY